MWSYIDKENGPWAPRNHPDPPGLLDLITDLRDYEASEPRDHVNGLLGLYKHFSPTGSCLLRPDYTSPLSSILRDATRAIINETRKLNVLGEVFPREQDSADVASWVPRWDRGWDGDYDPAHMSFQHRCCGTDRRVIFHGDARMGDPDVLSVLGMSWSSVTSIGAPQQNNHSASNEALELCASIERAHRDGGYNVIDLHEELAMVMVQGSDHLHMPISPDAALRKFAVWKKYLSENRKWPPNLRQIDDGLMDDDEDLMASQYHIACLAALIDRAIFIAGDGHIGLGPKTIASGDIISILWGCQWPVALRPLQRPGEYKFLGICYMYGIMQGEAVQADEEGNVEGEQVFHIR